MTKNSDNARPAVAGGRIGKLFAYLANLRLVDRRSTQWQTSDLESDARFQAIFAKCESFTMTSPERMYSLHRAVDYLVANEIPGDFVETGVWRGGCSMMSALTLLDNGESDRNLWLYDTYEGMVEPTAIDRSFDGQSAQSLFESTPDWCAASLDDVRTNMYSTAYPKSHMRFIEGRVEDTIPAAGVPDRIALLRLDTDWYVSNKHELENLFPLLVSGGVLIVDDYGHWAGVRKAVDEYLAANDIKGMLHRIDYTGRILVKE